MLAATAFDQDRARSALGTADPRSRGEHFVRSANTLFGLSLKWQGRRMAT
jgi:hypothetical protein